MAVEPHQRKPVPPDLVMGTSKATPKSESPLATPTKSKLGGAIPVLLAYEEIPEWHQDNEYILHGYRPESKSAITCFASWLYLHNETVNIFSHLVPAIFFLLAEGWMVQYLETRYPKATVGDHLMFAFFLLTAVVCLSLSAAYHTLMNHSDDVSQLWLRLDFVGIVIMILGDFVSGIYFAFYCEPLLQKIYWAMILTLGLATIIILVNPRFQGRRWRTFRLCTFTITGLSGLVPLVHGIALFGFEQMKKQSGILYYLGEGGVLALGAVVYMTRIPESFSPGRFDFFGCSHQIFHLLVVIASAIHFAAILSVFDYQYYFRSCIST